MRPRDFSEPHDVPEVRRATLRLNRVAERGHPLHLHAAGYIDLAPELRVFGRLDISEGALQIGMPVELVVRPVEDVANRFTYAFVSGRASTGEVRA
jgi:hypothetical protein